MKEHGLPCLPRQTVSPKSEEQRTVSSRLKGFHMATNTGLSGGRGKPQRAGDAPLRAGALRVARMLTASAPPARRRRPGKASAPRPLRRPQAGGAAALGAGGLRAPPLPWRPRARRPASAQHRPASRAERRCKREGISRGKREGRERRVGEEGDVWLEDKGWWIRLWWERRRCRLC